jgi:hypothetical protein
MKKFYLKDIPKLWAKSHISMGQSEVVLLGTHWELEEHVDPGFLIGELEKKHRMNE